MSKLIILVGPSGSGKTTLEHHLENLGLKRLVSHTTRSPRKGEQNKIDYYFVSEQKFNDTPMIEKVLYNEHLYGVSKKEFLEKTQENTAVVVCTPEGAKQIKKHCPDAQIVYLNVPVGIRKYRLVYDRGLPKTEAVRRIAYDEQVFKGFEPDIIIDNRSCPLKTAKQLQLLLLLEGNPNKEKGENANAI